MQVDVVRGHADVVSALKPVREFRIGLTNGPGSANGRTTNSELSVAVFSAGTRLGMLALLAAAETGYRFAQKLTLKAFNKNNHSFR